jgi:NAD(P)-dependent dehydrogenase (short-subunit alcohol dehydrogenase family)
MATAEFAGKRALVTGETKGMGEAIVRRLRKIGATGATTVAAQALIGNRARIARAWRARVTN